MALFVPVLRLVMLFLNVYEAYKTLKPPPPSLRDPTRPSIRASTQRKRDLKGCLAVWIIWCCFSAYERMVESVVSLFIPFYDEFKSMFMLFLIVTRARGAEPIFLHIVRPLLKPYTSTLDGTLDVLGMVGDFVFALSSYPFHKALAWWHERMKPSPELSDSDSETSSSQWTDSVARTLSNQSQTTNNVSAREAAQHERWVPPQSAYESDDEELNEAIDAPPEILDLTKEERAVEEWQKYPAFPSAYPATPLATTFQLSSVAVSFSSHAYPPTTILEDQTRQGFHRSLLLSRNLLNPSYPDGLSDRTPPFSGIYHAASTAGASSTAVQTEDDSDYVDEEEEEDAFNMTLRTPLPLHGAAKSRLMAKLTIPAPLASALSQSTAIPSAHTTASFRTGAWSESSQSASASPAETSFPDVDLEQTISPDILRSRVDLDGVFSAHKTPCQPVASRRQRSVRKRKMSQDLEQLTATSDSADDGTSDVPSPASGDEKEADTYIPGDQHLGAKRRRLRTKAIQPPRVARRPLAMRQTQQAIKPSQTSVPMSKTNAPVAAKRSLRSNTRSTGKRGPSSTGNSSSSALVSASSSTSSLSNLTRRSGNTSGTAALDP